MQLFESVPNFSEGRRDEDISHIAAAAGAAFVLDVDPDPDHHRVVISLVGERPRLVEGLLGAIASAVERGGLRSHHGGHPRLGAAGLGPLLPPRWAGPTSTPPRAPCAWARGTCWSRST